MKARETTIQTPTPKQDEEYNAPQPSPTAIIHTPLTIVHREIRIPAYLSGWVNTGLSLETGQKIILKQLKGGWTVDEGRYRRVDGNGHTDDGKTDLVYHKEYKIIPSAHFGAIIGKIGDQDTDDNAFPIGIDRQVIMQKSGTLCLRINDKDAALADNAGSITVEITVE